jgi:anti-anti-sigma regulatory factor
MDLELVDALVRLQLAAARQGQRVVLCEPPQELVELIDLCGLDDVLRVEVRRQAEQREERVGVEEERELGDPPVA